jgi:hypothetical protein
MSLPACLSADRYIGPGKRHLPIRSFRRRSRTNYLGCVRRVLTVACGPDKKKECFAGAVYLENDCNLDTKDVLPILTDLRSLLAKYGQVHMPALVLPEEPCVARLPARRDCGKLGLQPGERQRLSTGPSNQLFSNAVDRHFTWKMVCFKGRSRV